MASFLGNLMKGGGDATALRKKKFTEGTLRYNLFRQAQETLKVSENGRRNCAKRERIFFVCLNHF